MTYFPALTGVRALAYLVFVNHFNPFSSTGWSHWLHAYINEFYIGVSVFFVLSGFLITIRYYGGDKKTGTLGFSYFRNRVERPFQKLLRTPISN